MDSLIAGPPGGSSPVVSCGLHPDLAAPIRTLSGSSARLSIVSVWSIVRGAC
jgi:hypothetical protein